jgi:uncharacterized RDD family membrane protein YckC
MNPDPTNPYLPPKGIVTAPDDRRAIIPASRGRRFGTFIVDYVCFLGVSAGIGILLVLLRGETAMAEIEQIPDFLFGIVIMSAYYIFFESLWGRTPGKLVFGTIMVNAQGSKPSFGQIIGRTLSRFIPFEAFSCLGERGWHDSIPNTYVVLAKNPAGTP